MITTTYTTRDEAIQREIIDPIEASGEVTDAYKAFDVYAIAGEVLAYDYDGYWVDVDPDEFWRIVEKHERRRCTARFTSPVTITVFDVWEEIDSVTVEPSDDPEPYIQALQAAGWRVLDISGPDWIVEPDKGGK